MLILDDEAIVCKRLKPTFEKLGFEVESFTESCEALKRLKDKVFDVVITDLKMKGDDGIQVLDGAKASCPDTQVIIITGFATLETAKESHHKGAVDFIAKPFKIGELVARVKRLLEDIQDNLPSAN